MSKKYVFKPIPPFKSYEEEANFWDSHTVLKDWTEAEIIAELEKDKKKEEIIHVKVEPALKEAISRKAKKESRTV